jgi:hypothetical protein
MHFRNNNVGASTKAKHSYNIGENEIKVLVFILILKKNLCCINLILTVSMNYQDTLMTSFYNMKHHMTTVKLGLQSSSCKGCYILCESEKNKQT